MATVTTSIESAFYSLDSSEVWFQQELENFLEKIDNPEAISEKMKDLAVSRVMRLAFGRDTQQIAYLIVELAFLYLKQMSALEVDFDRIERLEDIIMKTPKVNLIDTDGDGIIDTSSTKTDINILIRDKLF